MPEEREIVERYWGVCRKWIFLYPCRKSRTVTKWCYDFSYLTVDYHGVYTNYIGCELNTLYSWRAFELTFSFDQFTLYFVTKCYGSLREEKGACSPGVATITHLRKALGSDLERVLRENKDPGETTTPEVERPT